MDMCIIRSICGLEHCYFVRNENKTQCSLKAVRALEACLVAELATHAQGKTYEDQKVGNVTKR
jgi:hypothetical protein